MNRNDVGHIELVDRVYARVKEMILNQELEPGQKIGQEAVAASLGVSRTPLLKALQRLEVEMLVESIPRRGLFVKQICPDELVDLFQCRSVVEGLSARLAAQRATPPEIDALKAIFEPFSHGKRINPEAYAAADRAFHSEVMRLGGNQVVLRMEVLSNLNLRAFQAGLVRPPTETLAEHQQIIEALSKRQGGTAEKRMRMHVDRTIKVLETAAP